MQNTRTKTNETRKTSLRMPEVLALQVDALAADDRRSFNQMVNILLAKAVASENKEQSDGENT